MKTCMGTHAQSAFVTHVTQFVKCAGSSDVDSVADGI